MERKINKKALTISIVFSLVSCALIYNYIRGLSGQHEEKPMVKVLVAARNIEAGEKIISDDITTIDVSEDSLPIGIINDRTKIEGFYSKTPILANEPFRSERLSKLEELFLSFHIPDKMRAITVFVSEDTILSNQIMIGDRVDVIGNFSPSEEGQKPVSKIILQNIEILSIEARRLQDNTTNSNNKAEAENRLPSTVTLCVTPQEAEKMAYTAANENYTFALRGKDDHKNVYTEGVLLENLITDSKINN